MSVQLYDSRRRTKVPFEPVTPGRAGIYFCGPTVYSEPHLGHARGPVVFDVLRNWLEHRGFEVRLVSNVTDVGHLTDDADEGDDKLAKRAKLEQLEPMEVADKYFWKYFDAMKALNVRRPDITPRATGHIGEQIAMTQDLLDRGLAYEANGSVYFDVSAWDRYGELSGRDPDELEEGARIEARSEKDDPRDFALWKRAASDHIMRWPSPWGEGFPGWHIECSVMSTKYLGDEFDIHGGGLDLIFPHHECELAQAAGTGKPFARTWMHWNMMTLEGEKMARSKNHFVTLAELFERNEPAIVRFHLLRSHYRSVTDFSAEGLMSSQQGLVRLRETLAAARQKAGGAEPGAADDLEPFERDFADAMDDDLNTPQAIAALFDAARHVNRRLDDADAAWAARAADRLALGLEGVLGVRAAAPRGDDALLGSVLDVLLRQRDEARLARDFATADAIRDELAELGVVVEDTAEGSRWKRG